MPANDPQATTVRDICQEALKDSGYLGIGQTAADDIVTDTWTRLQWMLQGWERKRWMVYHLVNLSCVSTGAILYTVGPGGQIDTGTDSARPGKLESAFLRQLQNSQPNNIDYWCEILHAREDYDKIALKSLVAFSYTAFLDSDWPLAKLYFWPVPQASIYELHVTIRAQLPARFASLNTQIILPYEYYDAIESNLAILMRGRLQIGTFPGDTLPNRAEMSMKTVRGPNTQIARLQLPQLNKSNNYNIFGDNNY